MAKMIEFECPECDHTMRVEVDRAGQSVKCEECGTLAELPPRKETEPWQSQLKLLISICSTIVTVTVVCFLIYSCTGRAIKDTELFDMQHPTITGDELVLWPGNERKLAGLTRIVPCRFGGDVREGIDGFEIKLVMPNKEVRQVWLGRESPRPNLQYGDLIFAVVEFRKTGYDVVKRITKQ